MGSVDNRVVEMQFKNDKFMDAVKETMGALDKLKPKLNFAGDAKGLDAINAGFKSIDTSSVTAGIEGISNKFLAMKTVAFSVVAEMTQKFLSFGEVLAKKILDPQAIRDGFKEYELNINSIQTILANTQSKGTTLDQVNDALDELNTYSDKTIYNFAEMTRNIGTFTAAGVDLQTSVESIKGIANLAAISGSSSAQAATAMYQLSQAIATGTVKLIDWNSVTNAGMGGEVFKTALFETGKALGAITNVPMDATLKQWEDSGKSFRESLESGWLTADVLTTTLKSLTGEYSALDLQSMGYTERQAEEMAKLGQLGVDSATKVRTLTGLLDTAKQSLVSGWSTSFRYIFGNFQEATELFSFVSSMFSGWISESAEARNSLLRDWKDIGGRTKLFEGVGHIFVAIEKVVRALGKAWSNVFPPATGATLLKLTVAFENLMEKLIPSEKTLGLLTDIFTGLFSILKLGVAIVKVAFNIISGLFGLFGGDATGGILSAAAALGRLITSFVNFITEAENLKKISDAVIGFFAKVKDALSPLAPVFEAVGRAMQRLGEIIKEALVKAWGDAADGVSAAGDKLNGVFSDIKAKLQAFAGDIVGIIDGLFTGGGGGGAGGAGGDSMFSGISERFQGMLDGLKNLFKPVGDAISGIKDIGKQLFEAIGEADWDRIDQLLKRLIEGGAVSALIIFATKLGHGLSILFRLKVELGKSVTDMLDGLTGVLNSMQTKLKAEAIKQIAIALAILAAAALVLSMVPGDKLAKSMAALSVGFGDLVGTLVLLEKFGGSGRQALAMSASLIAMSTSLLILAGAVKVLGGMDLAQVSQGVAAMTVILAALLGFSIGMNKWGKELDKTSVSLIGFGVGLMLITRSISKFGEMDRDVLIQGMIAFASTMAIITATVMNMPNNMTEIGLGIIGLSIGIIILIQAIKQMGEMDLATLNQGMLGFAAAMLILVGTMSLMPQEKMIEMGVGMAAVGIGLLLISHAVKTLGELKLGDLVKGIAALLAVFTILAIGLTVMEGTIAGSAALIVASVGIYILAKALKEIGQLSLKQLAVGLLAIAAVIAIFAAAAMLLTPALVPMLALGAALFLIGAGFALIGAAAYLAVSAFKMLSEIGPEGLQNMINAAKAVMTLLPELLKALALSFLEFLRTMLEAVPAFVPLIVKALGAIIDGLGELIPKIAEFGIKLIEKLLETLVTLYADIQKAGLDLLLKLLEGIRDHIGDIVTVTGEIITEYLRALGDELPKIIEAGVELLVKLLEGIQNAIGDIAPAVTAVIVALIDAIGTHYQEIIDAGGRLLAKIIEGFTSWGTQINTAITNMITAFITELAGNFVRLIQAGKDALIEILNGLGEVIPEIAEAALTAILNILHGIRVAIDNHAEDIAAEGRRLAGALINGLTGGLAAKGFNFINGAIDLAGKGASAFAEKAGINSPSKVFMGFGEGFVEGLVLGMENNQPALDAAAALATAVATATEMAITDVNPTITPVLDLSRIRSGARGINSVLGGSSLAAASTLTWDSTEADSVSSGVGGVTFTQIINAPKQLSTGDIYRQTKSQLALAREEMK